MAFTAEFWRGRRVLLTGHTGFKGAWLAAWLDLLGARVAGLSLPPDGSEALYATLRTPLADEVFADIREPAAIAALARRFDPEIVLHLAAQALVRPSYADPAGTYASNVVGTAHVLDAARASPGLLAAIVVTTDKVYENAETGHPFDESDRLGGHDPYSASKACAEILVSSYRRSFFANRRLASARAGNVIGGGDFARDRIIPDLVTAARADRDVPLRNPGAIRPWQHVLEPLAGYLALAERLAHEPDFASPALNFAPDPDNERTVRDLVEAFARRNGGKPGWRRDGGEHVHEAGVLRLSAAAAKRTLGWRPLLDFEETVGWTADWYAAEHAGADMKTFTRRQIEAYALRLWPAGDAQARKAIAL